MGKTRPGPIESIATGWAELVLICRKCGDSGFGDKGRDSLHDTLKHTVRARGQRGRVRLVRVDCLGVCPKRAVTVALGSRPDRLLTIPRGESGEAVLARLGVSGPDTTD